MKMLFFVFLFFLSLLTAKEKPISTPSKEMPIQEGEPAACLEECKRHRIEMRYQTPGGIGYNTGYSTLEGFFTQPISDSVLLMDARGHVFDDGNWAANAGFGFRTPIYPNAPTILGANAYYDYRLGLHGHYSQVAVGFEMLKEKWDIRLNGYFPVGRTSNQYKDGFLKFKKHSAYFAKRYQLAMTGGDIEVGRYLYHGKKIDLHAHVDGYYFSGRFGEKAVGGLLKFSSNFSHYFHADAQVSYDSLFKWLGQGTVGIRIPFGKQPKRSSFCSVSSRLYEPVSRFEIIVETKHLKKTVARDPETGDDLFFVFVDNVRGSSDGSYEHPYPTLLEAQNNSSPSNVLYVFSGDGTTRGMDQGITLKNSQQLLGSGVSHIFSTKFGLRTIPAQTATIPNISNTTNMSNTVTLANNNTVSGFNIKGGMNGNGIRGTGITSAVIDRNLLHGAGTNINSGNMNFNDNADIGFIDVNGNFIVTGNQTSSIIGVFFSEHSGSVSHTYNATISNNTHVPQQSVVGVRIWAFNQTQAQFEISSNHIALDQSLGFGHTISINPADQSDINALIQNNVLTNVGIAQNGIFLSISDVSAANSGPSSLNALIEGNVISDFELFGIVAQVFSVNAPPTLHTAILDVRNNTMLNNLVSPVGSGYGGFYTVQGSNTLARVRLVDNLSTTVAPNTFGYRLDATVAPFGSGTLLVDAPLGGLGLPSPQVIQSIADINPGTNNGGGVVQVTDLVHTVFLPLSNYVLSPYDPSL